MTSSPLIQLQKGPHARAELELRIGDLAKRTGKTQRALRLYEELGLLTPGTRTAGGFRVYGEDAIERVAWIAKLQELGFTLPQIQELVALGGPASGVVGPTSGDVLHGAPKESMARVRALFFDKQAELTAQIARLQQLKRELSASLEYLETCVTSCASTQADGTSCCGTCQTHGDEKAPHLVLGIQATDPTPPSTDSA